VDILQFARDWGPWAAVLVYIIVKIVDKFIPDALAHRQKTVERTWSWEGKLFELQERTLDVIQANTKAIENLTREFNAHLASMTRALDNNTRIIAEFGNKEQRAKPTS
jgi:hypothetical protein